MKKKNKSGNQNAKGTASGTSASSSTKPVLSEEDRQAARAKAAAGRATVSSSSSWTGKLPATLLQEHCQKQKWEKVNFDCRHTPDGFIITAVLGQKNQKTNEVEHVRFTPPKDIIPPQPTALEARHFAATYALHRVASHKNMKMILPGEHKTLWAKLDDVKKKTAASDKERLYSADPFAAEREHQLRLRKAKENAKVVDTKQVQIRKAVQSAKSSIAKETSDQDKRKIHFKNEISMSREIRSSVEKVIRKYHGFEIMRKSHNSNKATGSDVASIKKTLRQLGFVGFQIEESLEFASNLSEALEWLLTHLPEDDLPDVFNRTKNVGSTVSIQGNDLKTEYAVRELQAFGYDEELVRDTVLLSDNKFDALAALTRQIASCTSTEIHSTQSAEAESIWNDEIEGVKMVYDRAQVDGLKVAVELDGGLKVHVWRPKDYPNGLPGIGLESTKKVPKYALLDAVRRVAIFAQDYVGDCMIVVILDWLQENFDSVLQTPSKLSSISSGITGSIESTDVQDKKTPAKKRNRIQYTTASAEQLQQSTNSDKKMIESRQSLPAWSKREELVKTINDNQVVLITGETGSGKSTQVVQFILDDMIAKGVGNKCNILCTQPRRISAMGLAQRVADERGSPVGEVVGYSIRGETKASSSTMIRFMTTGVLLRMLQTDTRALDNISHVLLDEVHERSLDSSFLLILLRRLVKAHGIKVIMMSATVDTTAFKNYFNNQLGTAHIEGRTFPVNDFYLDDIIREIGYVPRSLSGVVDSDQVGRIILEMKDRGLDYDLISAALDHLHRTLDNGTILIFMSGSAEIDNCIRAIQAPHFYVLPLHASLPPHEQRRVFDKAPAGKRKIVVSTNVAETSITIPDAVAVIDSGRVKQTVYDPQSNVVRLIDNFASLAEVTQRRGRAGRVREGICYKLYTEHVQNAFDKQPSPEIKRAPLEQLYLGVCSMGVGDPVQFLSEALDPPETSALDTAKVTLLKAGAITSDGKLTSLGKHVSTIPADVRVAKLLVLSSVFGVLDKGLTIAAALSVKNPFVSPRDKREEAKEAFKKFDDGNGDLLAISAAYDEWVSRVKSVGSSRAKSWCIDNFLSPQVLFDIKATRRQYKESLQEIGFLPYGRNSVPESFDKNIKSSKLVQAVVGAALMPNLAEIVFPEKQYKAVAGGTIEQDPEAKSIRYFTDSERVFVHPSSLLFGVNKFTNDCKYLAFGSKMATTKLFVSQLTPVGSYGTLFFSDSIMVDPLGSGVVLRQWLGLKCWPRVGILVKALRSIFNNILEAKFERPSMELQNNDVVDIVINLIENEGR